MLFNEVGCGFTVLDQKSKRTPQLSSKYKIGVY